MKQPNQTRQPMPVGRQVSNRTSSARHGCAHDWAFGSALAMGVILILLILITIYFRAARRVTSAELAL